MVQVRVEEHEESSSESEVEEPNKRRRTTDVLKTALSKQLKTPPRVSRTCNWLNRSAGHRSPFSPSRQREQERLQPSTVPALPLLYQNRAATPPPLLQEAAHTPARNDIGPMQIENPQLDNRNSTVDGMMDIDPPQYAMGEAVPDIFGNQPVPAWNTEVVVPMDANPPEYMEDHGPPNHMDLRVDPPQDAAFDLYHPAGPVIQDHAVPFPHFQPEQEWRQWQPFLPFQAEQGLPQWQPAAPLQVEQKLPQWQLLPTFQAEQALPQWQPIPALIDPQPIIPVPAHNYQADPLPQFQFIPQVQHENMEQFQASPPMYTQNQLFIQQPLPPPFPVEPQDGQLPAQLQTQPAIPDGLPIQVDQPLQPPFPIEIPPQLPIQFEQPAIQLEHTSQPLFRNEVPPQPQIQLEIPLQSPFRSESPQQPHTQSPSTFHPHPDPTASVLPRGPMVTVEQDNLLPNGNTVDILQHQVNANPDLRLDINDLTNVIGALNAGLEALNENQAQAHAGPSNHSQVALRETEVGGELDTQAWLHELFGGDAAAIQLAEEWQQNEEVIVHAAAEAETLRTALEVQAGEDAKAQAKEDARIRAEARRVQAKTLVWNSRVRGRPKAPIEVYKAAEAMILPAQATATVSELAPLTIPEQAAKPSERAVLPKQAVQPAQVTQTSSHTDAQSFAAKAQADVQAKLRALDQRQNNEIDERAVKRQAEKDAKRRVDEANYQAALNGGGKTQQKGQITTRPGETMAETHARYLAQQGGGSTTRPVNGTETDSAEERKVQDLLNAL